MWCCNCTRCCNRMFRGEGEPLRSISVPTGTTVATMLRDVCGLPTEMQVFVAINGRSGLLSTELRDGDTVSVFMAVGGG